MLVVVFEQAVRDACRQSRTEHLGHVRNPRHGAVVVLRRENYCGGAEELHKFQERRVNAFGRPLGRAHEPVGVLENRGVVVFAGALLGTRHRMAAHKLERGRQFGTRPADFDLRAPDIAHEARGAVRCTIRQRGLLDPLHVRKRVNRLQNMQNRATQQNEVAVAGPFFHLRVFKKLVR